MFVITLYIYGEGGEAHNQHSQDNELPVVSSVSMLVSNFSSMGVREGLLCISASLTFHEMLRGLQNSLTFL
jgi:hypothetical protein